MPVHVAGVGTTPLLAGCWVMLSQLGSSGMHESMNAPFLCALQMPWASQQKRLNLNPEVSPGHLPPLQLQVKGDIWH